MGGRFTRLFPEPAYCQLQTARPRRTGSRNDRAGRSPKQEGKDDPEQERTADPEENQGIPAAYTYLGQFIDHDLTFDPISHLRETLTPAQLQALVDFRTPRFDLDNLYGRGPDDQPYLYKKDGIRMLLGEPMSSDPFDPGAVQLPRGPNGRALIGDPRNDENRIVAQLHAIFLRFHNRVVHQLRDARRSTSASRTSAIKSDGTTIGSWSTTSCPQFLTRRHTGASSRIPSGMSRRYRSSGKTTWSLCPWNFRWLLTASGTR